MEERIAEILHRKIAFMEDRRRSLGPEYYSSKEFWDRMWQQEWEALEERLNNPEGELDMPIDTVPMVFPTLEHKGHLLHLYTCLLYTSPSPRDRTRSRMPSSA